MIKRFIKVVDGLYRGSAPTPEDVIELHKNFNINKIISLDGDAGNRIHKITQLLNIKHIIIPIDMVDLEPIVKLLSYDLKKLLLDDGPTYIHCIEGKDRTGMVVAMFQTKYMNIPYNLAIKEAKKIGFGLGLDPSVVKFYERIIKTYAETNQDINNADIVDNARTNFDWRSSILDTADRSSFAPFMDPSKVYPYNDVYDYKYQNDTAINNKSNDEPSIPFVGQRDNDAGGIGTGVVENGGGFVNV